MSARVEGGRRRQASATAALVLPAALASMALMGVTSGPLLGVNEAHRGFQAAEELLAEFRLEESRLEALRRRVDLEAVEQRARELDGILPPGLEPLDAFTLLRLAARVSGLALESVDVGTLYDLVAVVDGRTVYMQDARVVAVDDPTALVRFLQALREGGYPVVVHDLSLARRARGSPEFQARMGLGLLFLAPPPGASPAPIGDPAPRTSSASHKP